MSTIDYKALAERVAQRAIYADNNADPNNKAWAADLRAVVSLLNGMADAQPVAWRCEVRDLLTQAEQCLSTAVRFEQWAHDEPPSYLSAWDYEADHIAAEIRAMLAAAPAAPQAEPKREPLTDERITKGEYVFATKWDDGDPGDHWGVGFYDRFANGRHYVVDSAGKQIRGNGFRRVGRITVEVGRWLLSAGKSLEASPPGTVNLWTMLTERAYRIGGSDAE